MLDSTRAGHDVNFTKGLCRGMSNTAFYPSQERGAASRNNRKATANAIALCNSCPIQKGCLDYAVRYEPLGIWGGKTEVEREVIRHQMGIRLPENRVISDSARRATRSIRFIRAVNNKNRDTNS